MQKIQDIQVRVPQIRVPEKRHPEPVYQEVKMESKKKSASKKIITISLLVVLFGGGGYYYFHSQQQKGGDATMIMAEVGKLVDLPQGETPTIATVTDLKPLESQEFFKDAQIGDKLLLFTASKRAILYRPSTKKIIVVAPLNN